MLLDDGRLEFVIQKNNGKTAEAKVCRGGMIKPEKSLAVAGKTIPMPALTDSDRENIRLAAKYGVTGVMQPFVRSCGDLMELKEALRSAGAGNVRIFAKIENMQGVRNLEELFPAADEIVIARGDLGNAMPLWELPGVQKELADALPESRKTVHGRDAASRLHGTAGRPDKGRGSGYLQCRFRRGFLPDADRGDGSRQISCGSHGISCKNRGSGAKKPESNTEYRKTEMRQGSLQNRFQQQDRRGRTQKRRQCPACKKMEDPCFYGSFWRLQR